jgi:hypothetical protein
MTAPHGEKKDTSRSDGPEPRACDTGTDVPEEGAADRPSGLSTRTQILR